MLSHEDVAAAVDALCGVRVLVVGDAMLDHYIVGSVDRISPEAPVPILRVEKEFDRVGGAANVAANITTLGGSAHLVCLTGREETSRAEEMHLQVACEARGVNPVFLRHLPTTIRKTRVLAGHQQLLRVDWEEPYGRTPEEAARAAENEEPWKPLPLSPEAQKERATLLSERLDAVDAILVSDYAKGMVDRVLMDQLLACGKPVVVDPRPQNVDLYAGITLTTPNRKEAKQMLGLDPRSAVAPEKLGRMLSDRLGAGILVTLGGDGMLLSEVGGSQDTVLAHKREVYDETGAGDTVVATATMALGAGLPLPMAMRLANAAASVTVGHIGTAAVSSQELRAALTV